jgi:L-2-hydroxyglutarate oxidase LhgO
MSEAASECEIVIVGAGVVGLALARACAERGESVVVLEAERTLGVHASSRNSEVIHAGIYYPPGSLKARLCVRGRELLYSYCAQRGIDARRVGKLIVACEQAELTQLDALRERAEQNGVHDLELLSAPEAQALEPAVRARGALLSPSTGILDSHALLLALKADAESRGAIVQLDARLVAARAASSGFVLEYGGRAPGALRCARLINAAGLFAPAVARTIEGLASETLPRAHFAKGHYFTLRGASPFSRLVYPLPSAHGLGIHVTLDLAGQARFGPDVSWVEGVDYAFDESRAAAFAAAIRRYFPALDAARLVPGYTGIRPKLGPEGSPASDFVVQSTSEHGMPGLINLFGIESPGLTASLALAEHICTLL